MKVTRRVFLRSGGAALAAVGILPEFLVRASTALRAGNRKLVIVFQRGAADGLNIVVPHGEDAYYRMRPNIAIPRPGREDGVLDLDGFFGLHPALGPLQALYDQGSLAVVHAAGSPDSTRSHFDAQDFMETGTPGDKGTRDGWLNRFLRTARPGSSSTFRAVSRTQQVPLLLQGREPALAVPHLERFGFGYRGPRMDALRGGLEALYSTSSDLGLASAAREAFVAVDTVDGVVDRGGERSRGGSYPRGEFGEALRDIAELIRADVGLETAFLEIGGWDHHVNEGGAQGQLANLLRGFGEGLSAFHRDLGERMEEVVLVTLSEFGRTVAENGNRGTDHGHATNLFVLGGPVKGGKVYGDWPGLDEKDRFEGRDLALTTDFRDVLGEILTRHLGAKNLETVFPGYSFEPGCFRGFLG